METDTQAPVIQLSDAQLDALADKVYERMKENLFAEIGKTVVQKFLYLLGVAALVFAVWAGGKGWLAK